MAKLLRLTLNLQLCQIPLFILDYNCCGHQTTTDGLRKREGNANPSGKHPPPPSNYVDPFDLFLERREGIGDLCGESYNTCSKGIERETGGAWAREATLGGGTEGDECAKEGWDEERGNSPMDNSYPEGRLPEGGQRWIRKGYRVVL